MRHRHSSAAGCVVIHEVLKPVCAALLQVPVPVPTPRDVPVEKVVTKVVEVSSAVLKRDGQNLGQSSMITACQGHAMSVSCLCVVY
jgi:hypothetical protein